LLEKNQLKNSADKRGNRDLMGICALNICLYFGTFFFYRTLNARRAKIWDSWTAEVNMIASNYGEGMD